MGVMEFLWSRFYNGYVIVVVVKILFLVRFGGQWISGVGGTKGVGGWFLNTL